MAVIGAQACRAVDDTDDGGVQMMVTSLATHTGRVGRSPTTDMFSPGASIPLSLCFWVLSCHSLTIMFLI